MLSICLKDFSIKDNILKSVLAIGIPAALGDVLMSVSNIIWNRIFKDFTYYQLSVWYVLCALQCITGYGSSYSRIDYQYEPSGTVIYIPAVFILQAVMGMDRLLWAQPLADVLSVVLVVY